MDKKRIFNMGINLNGQDVEWSISSIVTEYQIPKTLTCFNLYHSQSCFVLSMELILSNSCMLVLIPPRWGFAVLLILFWLLLNLY